MTGVGEFLRSYREQKGIRLEEIASITKIHIHQLELIERESWKDLPADPFLRGFLTAYAKYVGADPREVLSKYYEGKGVATVEPTTVPPMNATSPQSSGAGAGTPAMNPSRLIEQAEPFPFAKVMMAVGVVLLVVVVGTLITIGKKEASPAPDTTAATATTDTAPTVAGNTTAPVLTAPITGTETKTDSRPVAGTADTKPPTVENAPANTASTTAAATAPVTPPKAETAPVVAESAKPAETKSVETKPAATVATAPAKPAETAPATPSEFKHELALETQKKTWYKIVIDGKAPVQGMTKENDTLNFQAKDKIKLTLGNASGAKVLHNGKEEQGTKFSGTIRYFKYPSSARFPQDPPKPRAVTSDGESASTGSTSAETPSSNGQKTIGDWLDTPRPETQTQ